MTYEPGRQSRCGHKSFVFIFISLLRSVYQNELSWMFVTCEHKPVWHQVLTYYMQKSWLPKKRGEVLKNVQVYTFLLSGQIINMHCIAIGQCYIELFWNTFFCFIQYLSFNHSRAVKFVSRPEDLFGGLQIIRWALVHVLFLSSHLLHVLLCQVFQRNDLLSRTKVTSWKKTKNWQVSVKSQWIKMKITSLDLFSPFLNLRSGPRLCFNVSDSSAVNTWLIVQPKVLNIQFRLCGLTILRVSRFVWNITDTVFESESADKIDPHARDTRQP